MNNPFKNALIFAGCVTGIGVIAKIAKDIKDNTNREKNERHERTK